MIAWNSDVLTTAARLWPYLAHSYVTAATEATYISITSTGVTVVWVLQLLYMVKAREEKSSCLGHRCSQLLDAPWRHFAPDVIDIVIYGGRRRM